MLCLPPFLRGRHPTPARGSILTERESEFWRASGSLRTFHSEPHDASRILQQFRIVLVAAAVAKIKLIIYLTDSIIKLSTSPVASDTNIGLVIILLFTSCQINDVLSRIIIKDIRKLDAEVLHIFRRLFLIIFFYFLPFFAALTLYFPCIRTNNKSSCFSLYFFFYSLLYIFFLSFLTGRNSRDIALTAAAACCFEGNPGQVSKPPLKTRRI